MLIHQHRWNPSERERQRPRCLQTPKRLDWQFMAVITGFPSADLASQFTQQIRTIPSDVSTDSPLLLTTNATREEWMSGLERAAAWYLKPGSMAAEKPRELTFHWNNLSDSESLKLPFAVEHGKLDVAALDQQFYDATDEDDDRNYARLKQQRNEQSRLSKLENIGKELGLDPEMVEKVLHDSRIAMREELIKRRGKVGRKAREWISVREKNADKSPVSASA